MPDNESGYGVMNEAVLNDIQVDVETRYIEEQSNPE